MSLLKTLGGALLFTLLSASPALAQYRFGGPGVHVRIAPPAPIVERVPLAPSPRHIWAPGHWQWNPSYGRHVWVRGYYQLGAPGQIWVPARWINQGGEWVFYPAHWSRGGEPVYQQPVYEQPQPVYQQPQPVYQQPQPVYEQPQPVYEQPQPVYQQPQVQEVYQPPVDVQIESAPPPPQVEVIPAAPSPNHIWIAGYWGWRGGRHFWYPGRYEVRRVGQTWEAASWSRNGRYWRYAPGRWRAY